MERSKSRHGQAPRRPRARVVHGWPEMQNRPAGVPPGGWRARVVAVAGRAGFRSYLSLRRNHHRRRPGWSGANPGMARLHAGPRTCGSWVAGMQAARWECLRAGGGSKLLRWPVVPGFVPQPSLSRNHHRRRLGWSGADSRHGQAPRRLMRPCGSWVGVIRKNRPVGVPPGGWRARVVAVADCARFVPQPSLRRNHHRRRLGWSGAESRQARVP